MNITKETIQYVAKLARLNMSDEESIKMMHDMEGILEHVEKLNELDTSEVEPISHVMPVYNVYREDVVMPSLDRDKILANAPTTESGCFKVPKVVE
jgi:aspartyl-tRNA(Asn)/glutamyl-tRNA(Gln) amidotransferase subunit C